MARLPTTKQPMPRLLVVVVLLVLLAVAAGEVVLFIWLAHLADDYLAWPSWRR
jgi:hypothetical protein